MIALRYKINRARDILKTEGLASLVRKGFLFLVGWFFRYETSIIMERSLQGRKIDPEAIVPSLPDLTHRLVTTNQQANELVAEGFSDFREYAPNAWQRLDSGALALCIYVGQEPARMTWIAMSEVAKKSFNDIPYRVDFANKQACTGGTMTVPKYRRTGLHMYGTLLQDQYLTEMGIISRKSIISTSNTSSLRASTKISDFYSIASQKTITRSIRLLWWKSWKETPLS